MFVASYVALWQIDAIASLILHFDKVQYKARGTYVAL